MSCPQCNFDNPPEMKFCGQCGARLGRVCPQCSAAVPAGFRFCGSCGAPLEEAAAAAASALPAGAQAASPPSSFSDRAAGAFSPDRAAAASFPDRAAAATAPSALAPHSPPAEGTYTPPHLAREVLGSRSALEGERKQVTVLFCDLVGSTALADRLGPEVMHTLLNHFFELALGEVHRFAGTINQFLGDGFMALFGAPIAHEDHARRAVLAALGLQKLLADQQSGRRDGRDEIERLHGVELRVRMGINTGLVVVGGIGDHLRMDYTAVGDTTNLAARLQQLAEPGSILVSEATGRLVGADIQLEALPPAAVKGKADPVSALRVLAAGVRRTAQIPRLDKGLSPFVGRERELAILAELLEQAADGQGQVIGVAGEAGAGKSRLLYEFQYRHWSPGAAWMAGRCLSYGGGIPYLPFAQMLRSAWGIGETEGAPWLGLKMRSGLLEAGLDADELLPYFHHLMGAEGEHGRIALAGVEPQQIQARTFAALRQLVLAASQRNLVVLALEDLHWSDETSAEFLATLIEALAGARVLLLLTYRSGYQPRWLEKSYATQITMRRLSERDSRSVVEAVLRRASLPDELTHVILDKAEGNPFFLEELTRSVVEGGLRLDPSVPDTIQGVLMARIDRLPEAHKRLLQAAAVLGREFTLGLLQRMGPAEDAAVGAAALLQDLKRWEFIYEVPAAGDQVHCFKHALTQEVVYQSLLTSRRQALHAAAGRALEDVYACRLDEAYAALAHHFSKSGNGARAVDYLVRFAEQSAHGFAHAEAAKALREALAQTEQMPDGEGDERDRRSIEVALQLASSLLPLARFPETLTLCQRLRERLDRLDDPRLAGPFYFWFAHTHSYLGDQEEAACMARQAMCRAAACGDEATQGKACYVLARGAFWSGQFRDGLHHGREAIVLLERSGERWWQGQAYSVAGFHHYVLGQFAEAFEATERADAIWQDLCDPRLDPSWSAGCFRASAGDHDAGIESCRRGLERALDPLNTAAAQGFLGYAYLEKGDIAAAVAMLEPSVHQLDQAGVAPLLGWFSVYLAEAYLTGGRLAEARETAARGLAKTLEARFDLGAGLAERALGRIAWRAGAPAEAGAHLARALATFTRLGVPFELARTRLDSARLAHAAGDPDAAVRGIAEASRVFTALGVPLHAARAARLAEELALPLAAAGHSRG